MTKVWAALNDPEVLKQCIPGCQALDMTAPNEMTATVVFKVGPVKATFGGKVMLSDLDAAERLSHFGRGFGGVAGFAKGGATVKLVEEGPDVTILNLRGGRADRRQAGAARQPLDRLHGKEAGGPVLRVVRRGRRQYGKRVAFMRNRDARGRNPERLWAARPLQPCGSTVCQFILQNLLADGSG